LQFALDEIRKLAELQRTQLDEKTKIIAVLRGLIKEETVSPGGGPSGAEPSHTEVKPVNLPIEGKENEAGKHLRLLTSQLEASEAIRQTLVARVGRLQSRLLDFDPSLKIVGSGEIDLNADVDWEQVSITVVHSQDYDYPLSGRLQFPLGVTELQYQGQNPGFYLSGESSVSDIKFTDRRSVQLQAFKAWWLVYEPRSHHSGLYQVTIDPSLSAMAILV
jgi:hypothetical protein